MPAGPALGLPPDLAAPGPGPGRVGEPGEQVLVPRVLRRAAGKPPGQLESPGRQLLEAEAGAALLIVLPPAGDGGHGPPLDPGQGPGLLCG